MSENRLNSRREFLQKLIALTALAGVAPYADAFGQPYNELRKGKLPLRPLGRTGQMVSIYSLGGQGSIEVPGREDVSVEIINRAIDLGINYIDTAAAYGRETPTVARADAMGTSERNMGQVMKYRRKEVFLASKTHDRTYDGSMKLLEKSLKQLNTDHLDLWQIHNVRLAEMETLDKITGEGGVLKAMIKARDEKMIRFIGFSKSTSSPNSGNSFGVCSCFY